jgi:hypothetical protein
MRDLSQFVALVILMSVLVVLLQVCAGGGS